MATVIDTSHSYTMNIAVSQISKLESIFTSEVSIFGVPWKVKILKLAEEGAYQSSFALRLMCTKKDKPRSVGDQADKWSVSGALSCKLLPFSDGLNALEAHLKPDVFDHTRLHGIGFLECIPWADLFDADNHYVKDDTIKLELKIQTENPNNPTRSDVQFECLSKSCESECLVTFQLKIRNFSNLMAVRTTRFCLRGLWWNITIGKDDSADGLFGLLDFDGCQRAISCKVMWSISLLSQKNDVDPIGKNQTELLLSSDYLIMNDIAPWTEIFKPDNGFVNDDSITLEIEIKANKPQGDIEHDMPMAKRARFASPNETMSPQMECPICFKSIDGQELAATRCGHLFCLACIQNAITVRAVCPTCDKTVRMNTLRRLYLPL